jgi:hypothetical protein
MMSPQERNVAMTWLIALLLLGTSLSVAVQAEEPPKSREVLRRHLRIPGIRFQLARARRFANNGHHLTPVSERLAVSIRTCIRD